MGLLLEKKKTKNKKIQLKKAKKKRHLGHFKNIQYIVMLKRKLRAIQPLVLRH